MQLDSQKTVCVIGHVTRDIIRQTGRSPKQALGGVVFYAGIAYQKLGLRTTIVTKAAYTDHAAIRNNFAKHGICVHFSASEFTTAFENIYSDGDDSERTQRVITTAVAFNSSDLNSIHADVLHLGPLTEGEMSLKFIESVVKRGQCIVLDVQGLVRRVHKGNVYLHDWPDKLEGLAHIDILKASQSEAEILAREPDPVRAARKLSSYGPKEVIITLGSRGSLILAQGNEYRIPAFPAHMARDSTGCGDTYLAGYVSQRLAFGDIQSAGRFAAAVATLKLESDGPFTSTAEQVSARLSRYERNR